ncbi:MAG: NUDIX domain-containing protein [Candidatus Pacebacteria bacterium]|nr:NUDIX domain-containing protein [Candidatus Paceibacterota bacterium]
MKKTEKDFYQVSLKIILNNKKGETLILKGWPSETFKGMFDLPGGRIESNEFEKPIEKIIAREVKEEIGSVKFKINLKPVGAGRCITAKSKTKIFYILFEAKYQSGKIKISEEHMDFKWVKLNKKNVGKLFHKSLLEGVKMYLS